MVTANPLNNTSLKFRRFFKNAAKSMTPTHIRVQTKKFIPKIACRFSISVRNPIKRDEVKKVTESRRVNFIS